MVNVTAVVLLVVIIIAVTGLLVVITPRTETTTTTVLNVTPFDSTYMVETTDGIFFSQRLFQIPERPARIVWGRTMYRDDRWIQSIELCYGDINQKFQGCHTEYMPAHY